MRAPVKLCALPPLPMPLSVPRNPWKYLRDPDVLHAAAIAALVLLLSGGLVWLGYVVHVLRIAVRSPLLPPRRMTLLVFGRRLEDDAPGTDYRWRLQRALDLVRRQYASHVLLLGGRSGGQVSEAAVGHDWLRQQGLGDEVPVELEQDSTDSLENLRHARRLLQAGGAVPPVALVTSRYHLARCLALARRLGFEGVPVAAESSMPWRVHYLGRIVLEASYLMWIDIGVRWARLIGNTRMAARIS